MKTAPTNKKVRELIRMVKDEKLIPRPEFQRRLVWTHKDKDHFLDTVLRGYPFPEIYLADGDVNLESGEGTQLLVDGLQRVSTLIEYFDGSSNLKLTKIPPYKDLQDDQKSSFLQYDVAVRDLGSVEKNELIEVFKRINATKYSLQDIEINNAVYSGDLIKFSEKLSENSFFIENGVFNAKDFKRMGDLRYTLTIIITMLGGYFNRDEEFSNFLEAYNDSFDRADEISTRIRFCFDLITECGFDKKSRIWKKADLLSAIIEIDNLKQKDHRLPDPSEILERLESLYQQSSEASTDGKDVASIYYKSSIQATNDKVNRIRRAHIVNGTILGKDADEIWSTLKRNGLC